MFNRKFSSNIRRKKRMITCALITIIFGLGIGYAAFSTNLGISGDLGVSKYNPDIVQIEFVETSTPESQDGYDIGEDFAFDIKVKNLKKIELTNVIVTIEESGDEYEIGDLASAEEHIVQSVFNIYDLDPEVNVLTAVVTGLINDEEFTVTKKINIPVVGINNDLTIEVVADPPASGGDSYSFGEMVNYTVTVTNTGNTSLEVDTVMNELYHKHTFTLAPGGDEKMIYGNAIGETDIENGIATYIFKAVGKRSGEVVVEKNKTVELNVNSQE